MTTETAPNLSLRTDLFIEGEFVPSGSGKRFATVNPATGETLAEVAEASKEDLDRAVASARKALESGPWAAMKPRQRGRILMRAADLLLSRAEEFGRVETLDNGKPIFESAKIDMPAAAECLAYFGEYADKLYGDSNRFWLSESDASWAYTSNAKSWLPAASFERSSAETSGLSSRLRPDRTKSLLGGSPGLPVCVPPHAESPASTIMNDVSNANLRTLMTHPFSLDSGNI